MALVLSGSGQAPGPRPRRRGSSRSRIPSPSTFIDRTTSMMASPGNVASHQPVTRYSLPSARDIPQLGVGGGTPRPRNDSVDSSTMRRPISVVMMTSAYDTTFGRRCRPRIHHAEAQRLAAHDASVRHPAAEREDDQEVPEARPEDRDDGDREEEEGKGE